jgi:hypothetical protein
VCAGSQGRRQAGPHYAEFDARRWRSVRQT